MDAQEIGRRMRIARAWCGGINQGEFGALINRSRSTIGRWEDGDGLPDDFVLSAIADRLGLARTYFVEESVVLPAGGPRRAASVEAADFSKAMEAGAEMALRPRDDGRARSERGVGVRARD